MICVIVSLENGRMVHRHNQNASGAVAHLSDAASDRRAHRRIRVPIERKGELTLLQLFADFIAAMAEYDHDLLGTCFIELVDTSFDYG
jgi:hypothetical protein